MNKEKFNIIYKRFVKPIADMKIDCNKQCDYCPATICEKRGNCIDAGATSNINEKYTQNSYADVTLKFIRK